MLEASSLPGLELIYTVAMITVFFSIFAHGITAAPAADMYAKKMSELDQKGKVKIENKEISEIPLRTGDQ